ncbi:MAG: glycosyl hydrolase, partial [Armatimonadota bacterium]
MNRLMLVIATFAAALIAACGNTPAVGSSLEQNFATPPASARPWVYWFWLNGNITREGITADLEAMQRVGIGGALIMEVDVGVPVGPVDFAGAKWRELFKHVVSEAKRLGLEINMNNDAGWNGSGGPWIKPEVSMQKVVWSEKDITGPMHIDEVLPAPEMVAGYYRDVKVLAFPTNGAYRIPGIRAKAAYTVDRIEDTPMGEIAAEMIVDRSRVIDLSDKMDVNGKLIWDVPVGSWTVMRFGHTSTGAGNGPAPRTGAGLECDKLSKEGIEANFNGLMGKLVSDSKADAGRALAAVHIDSWEIGGQNWTARMPQEFTRRRGYDPRPFLPVMTGRVVGSTEISERFLWDLRRTVSELVVENYAGHMRDLTHAAGIRFTMEAYGGPCDALPYGGMADEPMGEFWVGGYQMDASSKGMASSGHVYGKRIIGAEAFTAWASERWQEYPGSLKTLADKALCQGINRLVFHRYAHQPWKSGVRPGMTMGPYGVHYERTQTWWEQSGPWHKYLARCQYLLRQGMFVADICYLQPQAPPYAYGPHPRRGYDWDECDAETVMTRMSVKNGRITLPDGMSYRVLVLPQTRQMTPALLRKIGDLVRAGATVIGFRPIKSPSLQNYPECDREVQKLSDSLWGDCDGVRVKERRIGKGRILCGISPEMALANSGVKPDFAGEQQVRSIHRSLADGDLYFVANTQPTQLATTCTFRVSGRTPELWQPETGLM